LCGHDGAVSRAILIGCGRYEDQDLADLPEVGASLAGAADVLKRGGIASSDCTVLIDPSEAQIHEAFRSFHDSGEEHLLFWFAGHSVAGADGRPLLAMGDSRVRLPLAELLRDLSREAKLTAVLDCAFPPWQRRFVLEPRESPMGARVLASFESRMTDGLASVLRDSRSKVPQLLTFDSAFEDAVRQLAAQLGPGAMGWINMRQPAATMFRLWPPVPPWGLNRYLKGGIRFKPKDDNARHVNVDFVEAGSDVPVAGRLKSNTRYLLNVDIGPLRRTEIFKEGTQPFPTNHLPASDVGWWLELGLSSADVTCEPAYQRLFLGVTGPAFTCDCDPSFSHGCQPSQRTGHVGLPFTTGEPGPVKLQLAVYYETAAVQVLQISTAVGAEERVRAPFIATSEVVFSLTRDLASLGRYAGRTASIVSSEGDHGRHHLLINDGQGRAVEFELIEHQAATAARELRHQLFDIHLHRTAGGEWRSRYGPEFERPQEDFIRDLHRLALAGRESYVALFPDAAARIALHRRLADMLASGQIPIIQVARAAGSRIAIPWQALYELPIPSDLGSAAICPSVHGGRCPYDDGAGHPGEQGVLCPFGFWGYSYMLEIPPFSKDSDLAIRTGNRWPATILMAANESVIAPVWQRHHGELARICGVASVPVATDSPTLRRRGRDGTDVLYFLCHGVRIERLGAGPPKPALELRPGDRITPQDLADWAELYPPVRWEERRPLVLLNGCHTGEVLPDTLTDFVSAFVGSLGAAGVLAAEIAIDRDLACHAMEHLIGFLWEGDGVGKALWRLRRLLLRRGNLMGLAYSPYCDATLHLPPKSEGFTWQAVSSSPVPEPPASAS